jgi:hypothetical protein
MDFSEALQQYSVLKKLFADGKLSEKDFESEVDNLVVVDRNKVQWKISAHSGQWHWFTGQKWVEGDPARQAPGSGKSSGKRSAPTSAPAATVGKRSRLSTIALAGIIASGVVLVAVIVLGVILLPRLLGHPEASAVVGSITPQPAGTAVNPLPTATPSPTLSPTPEGPSLEEIAQKLTVANIQIFPTDAQGYYIFTAELNNENDFGVEDIGLTGQLKAASGEVVYDGYVSISLPDLPAGGTSPISVYLGQVQTVPTDFDYQIEYATAQPDYAILHPEMQFSQLSVVPVLFSDYADVSFIGAITNPGPDPVMVDELIAVPITADGRMVGAIPDSTSPWNIGYLDPGDTVPFVFNIQMTQELLNSVDSYIILASATVTDPITDFWEMSHPEYAFWDSNSTLHDIAAFQNNSSQAYPLVVVGWMTDENGNLLDVSYDYATPSYIPPGTSGAFDLSNWFRVYNVDGTLAQAANSYTKAKILPYAGGTGYEVTEILLENPDMQLESQDTMHFTGDITSDLSRCDEVTAEAVAILPDGSFIGYGTQYVSPDQTSLDLYITYDSANTVEGGSVGVSLFCLKYPSY